MNKRKVTRVLAIVLVVLLAGGAVVSALIGAMGLAEDAAPGSLPLDRQEMTIEYLEDEQALHISQRLVYTNRSGGTLDRVVFHAAGNMFRRASAIMYEADDLSAVFPRGYAPAGIDLRAVQFDGADADYGFQGEEELWLRVACELAPGETGTFAFDYYLLLMDCDAFQGVGETEIRASAFYFAPAVYDASHGEYIVNRPLPFARWMYCDAADFEIRLILPENCAPAAPGTCERGATESGKTAWGIRAQGFRDFAFSFSKRWRKAERSCDGVQIEALAGIRGGEGRLVEAAARSVERCGEWLGALPMERLVLAQTDYPLGAMNFPGLIWIPGDLLEAGRESDLEMAVRFCVAQQYLGMYAYVEPSADAWLSDSVCEYLAYLMLEEADGRDAFLKAVNRDWVSALQQTVPGGLRVTSDAMLFDSGTYQTVVRVRGAVVMHELRSAMGRDGLLAGLRRFCDMGGPGRTLTEMDFVHALDEATGGDWEDFLTDWVFNVGEYVNQSIDWFE